MSDGLRALRNIFVGAALVALSAYMLVYVGHLKRVYEDWVADPRHHTAAEVTAGRLWPTIQAYQKEHEILWEIAPLSPPYGGLNQKVWFTWLFVRVNWRFLVWLVLLIASGVMVATGNLVAQLNHEERLEKMRMKRRGSVAAAAFGVPR